MKCGLCFSESHQIYHTDHQRSWTYFQCRDCQLIFRDPKTWLSASEEKHRYLQHNNGPQYPGYLDFLRPAVELLVPHLKKGARGLDYGSGPGPALDLLFGQRGFEVINYDPLFSPQLNEPGPFDFIACTEVIEHFYEPHRDFAKMVGLLKSKGHLVLMTDFVDGVYDFSRWSYRFDDTHVSFFSEASLNYITEQFGLELRTLQPRLALLQKQSDFQALA